LTNKTNILIVVIQSFYRLSDLFLIIISNGNNLELLKLLGLRYCGGGERYFV